MSKPTLCVIVPVYKAAATLDRCVAAVLAQQVAGAALYLVDDGKFHRRKRRSVRRLPPETPA